MNPRIILTAAVAGLFCAQALVAQPAKPPAKPAAAAPAGPWAKVPALPTACYLGQDQWWDQNNAALDAVQQDHYRQNDINAEIQQQSNDAFAADPMAVVARMQQAMLDDPQNAQKMMEEMVKQGEQLQTEVPAQLEKEKQIEAESKTVLKQYEAALAKAMAPGNARWAVLRKKHGLSDNARSPEDAGLPDADWLEWNQIRREWDRAYVTTCAQWWAATGPIHGYMKRYKDFLVLERTPHMKKLDEPKLQQFKQLNIPATGWRTTTDYEAAEKYLKMASSVFGEREHLPRCRPETHCE